MASDAPISRSLHAGDVGSADSARTHPAGPRPKEPVFFDLSVQPGSAEDVDEAALVRRVLGGERDLFRTLVERHQHSVYRLSLRFSSGDPERARDLAQEVFLRAYRGLAGFSFDSKFGTWLYRVAVNVAISQRRRERAEKRGSALSLDAPPDPSDPESRRQVSVKQTGPSDATEGVELRSAVRAAIDSLEDDLRVLVVLVSLEERTYEEAAQILSIPVGTVRSRMHRARGILAHRLKSHWMPGG